MYLRTTRYRPWRASATIAAVAALVWWLAMLLAGAVVAAAWSASESAPFDCHGIDQNSVLRQGRHRDWAQTLPALASALVVAVMGAIVLAGLGVTPERSTGAELRRTGAGVDVAEVFRWCLQRRSRSRSWHSWPCCA